VVLKVTARKLLHFFYARRLIIFVSMRGCDECLQTVVTGGVVGGDLGDVKKLTWMWDLWFWRQGKWLWSFLCCSLLATRRRECNVLGITREPFNALPQFQCCFIRVKAEADYLSVICGREWRECCVSIGGLLGCLKGAFGMYVTKNIKFFI
jgi:hypothetical protein